MRLAGMTLVLCAVIGLVGCGSSPTSGGGKAAEGDKKGAASLVGTWEATEPELKGIKLVLTFTGDGKFTQATEIEGLPKDPNVKVDGGKQEGTYKQDDKTVTLTTAGKDKKLTVKELTDSKAVFANEQGKDMTFTKKK